MRNDNDVPPIHKEEHCGWTYEPVEFLTLHGPYNCLLCSPASRSGCHQSRVCYAQRGGLDGHEYYKRCRKVIITTYRSSREAHDQGEP